MTTQPSLIVTSDEDDGHLSSTSTSDEEDGSFPESNDDTANNNNDNDDTESPLLSENVVRQIDRLGRMSKLMIEMEYCHRQMQAAVSYTHLTLPTKA